jgi:peptidoglycan/LPS O-acetylase OafA/YrhL
MINISKTESQAMRGIAILAIVMHNYCHWLGKMVQENEYQFFERNVRRLMVEVAHPSWEIIAHLLSFFGHYGVPVFVFLSAYGLVMKYEKSSPVEENASSFIWKHYKKLFFMMIVGYSAYVMVDYMTPAPRRYEFWNVIGQLGMFSNLYKDPDHDIWPGPYWYFGLMVQIYILYRLVFHPSCRFSRNKWIIGGLFAVTLLSQLFFRPEGMTLQWYRYNVMGSLPVFIVGLMFARYNRFNEPTRTSYACFVIASVALIFLFSLWFATWIIVPFLICIGTVALVKLLPQSLLKPLVWVGGISASMFVCHPITRKVIIPISRHGDIYAGLILYLVATIVLAMVFSRFFARSGEKRGKVIDNS